ncbi:hypothetical protein SpCBS45565_g07955 [Spizellomyces sp. 'palustris']|nr:hypothetical protein SpCBS45565_g07955 [Spizellomyces sp. 'palustris']
MSEQVHQTFTIPIPVPTAEAAIVGGAAIASLFEFCQKNKLPAPEYTLSSGPPFCVNLQVNDALFKAEGFQSKQDAKRTVAAAAVQHLQDSGHPYFNTSSKGGLNFISLLGNWCAANMKEPPEYFIWADGQGPTNGPWKCRARVAGQYFHGYKSFTRKQDAKESAAKLAFKALTKEASQGSSDNPAVVRADPINDNAARISSVSSGGESSIRTRRLETTESYCERLADWSDATNGATKVDYFSRLLPNGQWIAQVSVGEQKFTSLPGSKTEVQAKESAAAVAWETIGGDVEESSGSSGVLRQWRNTVLGALSSSWGLGSKRSREEASDPDGVIYQSSGEEGSSNPTYCELLHAECLKLGLTRPTYSYSKDIVQGGVKCKVMVNGKTFETLRAHSRKSTAKEDACGDAYKWLKR